jgi:hypothetical protein
MSDLFKVHLLNELGIERAKGMATRFSELIEWLEQCAKPLGINEVVAAREMAIVKTHLETACFFAKKAMAMNPENQK